MDQLPDFVRSYWQSASGQMQIGGLAVSAIVARHGAPLFVYDCSILERKFAVLRATLPKRFGICYSVKANPNPAFLKFFREKGCGLEIASAGEFYLAREAGCPPEAILFAGPGKTESELELAIGEGIGEIHAESELEIERISAISRRLGVHTRISLRVNPAGESLGGAMLMGGKSAAFGVDEERLEPLLRRIDNDVALDLRGIHLFVGTQILDHNLLLAQYRKAVRIAMSAAGWISRPVMTLDFGGGWGIPYFSADSELDLARLSHGLHELVTEIENQSCFKETTFVVEPGRFLVGESGVYIARINDIKTSRGKKYLILDGGMNHHLAASGNLGQVVKRNFPVSILGKFDTPASETVDLVGPLCTPLDTLGRSVRLPAAEVGDLVGIFQSGAYARTASPLGFLSHPTPPEVWVENGQDFLIRRRGSIQGLQSDVEAIPAPAGIAE